MSILYWIFVLVVTVWLCACLPSAKDTTDNEHSLGCAIIVLILTLLVVLGIAPFPTH